MVSHSTSRASRALVSPSAAPAAAAQELATVLGRLEVPERGKTPGLRDAARDVLGEHLCLVGQPAHLDLVHVRQKGVGHEEPGRMGLTEKHRAGAEAEGDLVVS